jgi:hypothetical protein
LILVFWRERRDEADFHRGVRLQPMFPHGARRRLETCFPARSCADGRRSCVG